MVWAVPQYSRNQVDKAGDILAGYREHEAGEWLWAVNVLNNWRASHSFPLNNFTTNLRTKVRNVQGGDAVVAQRLKRLESIVAKLARQQTKTLQMSQMQDIGGCRAILTSEANVRRLVSSYKRSKFAHELVGEKDYINVPKEDGYRGYHLVYRYKALEGQSADFDKLRLEVQARSKLQHAWATAVEAVGAFSKQALKSNQGDQDWLRLFALMSSVIACIEQTPCVYGTPSVWKDLRAEIIELAMKLHAVNNLQAHRVTLGAAVKLKRRTYALVHYKYEENHVSLLSFAEDKSQEANAAYTDLEGRKKPGDNVVLVKADSLRALTKAYPNYFLDTEQFTKILRAVIRPPFSTLHDVIQQLA